MKVYRIRRLGAVVLLALTTIGADLPDDNELVRVKLFAGAAISEAKVGAADGGRLTIYDSSGALATLDEDRSVDLSVWNEFLRVRWRAGSAPVDRAVIKSSSGRMTLSVNGESRDYRGVLDVTLDGDVVRPNLVVINEVALSDYIASVLPAEYGFTEPEGMKAQAIVIRTYALRARSQRQGTYDVTDDTGSQVYLGASSETELARAAVRATSGMTITHNGELIEAVYSAHCGGHSADNEDVWSSKPVSYLRGREDPYDHEAPVAKWESRVKKDELLDLLSRVYDAKVKDIEIVERGSGKRATMIRLDAKGTDINVTAQSFRVAVNNRFGSTAVKSTFFDIHRDGDNYRFTGRGLGHGVGLCQWGTAAQARSGRSYRDILAFYYNDVKIEGYESDFQVASASLADAAKVERPHEKVDVEIARADPPPNEPARARTESKQNTRRETARSTTLRKVSGRRVGW